MAYSGIPWSNYPAARHRSCRLATPSTRVWGTYQRRRIAVCQTFIVGYLERCRRGRCAQPLIASSEDPKVDKYRVPIPTGLTSILLRSNVEGSNASFNLSTTRRYLKTTRLAVKCGQSRRPHYLVRPFQESQYGNLTNRIARRDPIDDYAPRKRWKWSRE